jgi:Uma2 family endonuclease
MTVTDFPVAPEHADGWTVDDLDQLPDDGLRYELIDGSLLVSPPPFMPHGRSTNRLHKVLIGQVPAGFEVGQNLGVTIDGPHTCLVPDLFVVRAAAYDKHNYLDQKDVLLVVEVLSPSSRSRDLLLKRHYYAGGGIPRYWIVDPTARTLTVLSSMATATGRRRSCRRERPGRPPSRFR